MGQVIGKIVRLDFRKTQMIKMSHKITQKSTKGDIIFKEECYRIIECAFTVWKELGYGFLEKVYPVK